MALSGNTSSQSGTDYNLRRIVLSDTETPTSVSAVLIFFAVSFLSFRDSLKILLSVVSVVALRLPLPARVSTLLVSS